MTAITETTVMVTTPETSPEITDQAESTVMPKAAIPLVVAAVSLLFAGLISLMKRR